MDSKYLVSIIGPTAIGKTATSIHLAKKFSSEIISADSRQFYKEMSIGTAVPSKEELAAVKHHFIQHISIEENYSVGDFETEAVHKTDELFKKHRILFLVGGSGLYVDAVNKGLDYFPKVDASIREELNHQLAIEGIEPLQQQLKLLDPVYAQKVDLENPHRLIRALEICIGTEKPYSGFLKNSATKRNFNPIKIGLSAPRELVYKRIEMRVNLMVENGLIEEAKDLYPKRDLNALNTVGYKELFKHFDGQYNLDFALQEIKKNTRRFAKRQLTWFRKDPNVKWFDYNSPVDEIGEYILSKTSPE